MIYRRLNCSQLVLSWRHLRCIFTKVNRLGPIRTKCTLDALREQEDDSDQAERAERIKSDKICRMQTLKTKKKYAIMFSYLGKGYYGIQRSPHVPTIEEELLKALYKVGIISESHYLDPWYLWYQKASRTDKGVSASRQIVSLFLERDLDTKKTVEKINEHICPQIRIMGIKRVTKSFDAKENCNARLYSYMMPSFAFCPVEQLCTESYRLPSEKLETINSLLKEFVGVHNFQNFTTTKEARIKGCYRNIFSCECGEPFVREGVEFVVIRIKGQSFMLHQIRMMIGLTISIVRGLASIETLKKNLETEKVIYQKAPGLGLILEDVYYDNYNWTHSGNGLLEPLLWEEYQDEVHRFRTEYLLQNIIETEIKEKSMMKWLAECYYYSYEGISKKTSRDKLYAAIAHLRRLRKEQEEVKKGVIHIAPNR